MIDNKWLVNWPRKSWVGARPEAILVAVREVWGSESETWLVLTTMPAVFIYNVIVTAWKHDVRRRFCVQAKIRVGFITLVNKSAVSCHALLTQILTQKWHQCLQNIIPHYMFCLDTTNSTKLIRQLWCGHKGPRPHYSWRAVEGRPRF